MGRWFESTRARQTHRLYLDIFEPRHAAEAQGNRLLLTPPGHSAPRGLAGTAMRDGQTLSWCLCQPGSFLVTSPSHPYVHAIRYFRKEILKGRLCHYPGSLTRDRLGDAPWKTALGGERTFEGCPAYRGFGSVRDDQTDSTGRICSCS